MTDSSHDAEDDGFHEIQLSGKQLVFLFMATTVVSVVIFLCGVLVGRGVRGEALKAADNASPPLSAAGPGVSTANIPPPAPSVDPNAAADKPLTYGKRLESDAPVREEVIKPHANPEPAPVPASAALTSKPPAAEPGATKVQQPPKPGPTVLDPPTPTGGPAQPGVWAVQVVALTDKAAATAVRDRLSAKGYPAFLVQPQTGAPVQNYKVQVGKFEDRSQAEVIAGRLKKEEQFQPWILR